MELTFRNMQENKVTIAFLGLIVVFIGGVLLRLAKPVLFPFFLAIFISFVLYPVLDFLTRLKIPKAVSILFILIITFFVLYLLGVLFYSSGKAFASEFPKYGQKISSILESLEEKFRLTHLKWDPLEWVGQLDINKIGSFLLASLGPFFSFISNLFLILIFLDKLVNKKVISLKRFIEMISTNPAKILGFENKGKICIGADADLTILNLYKEIVVDVSKFKSKSRNNPFHDWKLKGTPAITIVGGKIVYPF